MGRTGNGKNPSNFSHNDYNQGFNSQKFRPNKGEDLDPFYFDLAETWSYLDGCHYFFRNMKNTDSPINLIFQATAAEKEGKPGKAWKFFTRIEKMGLEKYLEEVCFEAQYKVLPIQIARKMGFIEKSRQLIKELQKDRGVLGLLEIITSEFVMDYTLRGDLKNAEKALQEATHIRIYCMRGTFALGELLFSMAVLNNFTRWSKGAGFGMSPPEELIKLKHLINSIPESLKSSTPASILNGMLFFAHKDFKSSAGALAKSLDPNSSNSSIFFRDYAGRSLNCLMGEKIYPVSSTAKPTLFEKIMEKPMEKSQII